MIRIRGSYRYVSRSIPRYWTQILGLLFICGGWQTPRFSVPTPPKPAHRAAKRLLSSFPFAPGMHNRIIAMPNGIMTDRSRILPVMNSFALSRVFPEVPGKQVRQLRRMHYCISHCGRPRFAHPPYAFSCAVFRPIRPQYRWCIFCNHKTGCKLRHGAIQLEHLQGNPNEKE